MSANEELSNDWENELIGSYIRSDQCDDLGSSTQESDDECPEEEISLKSDSDVLKSLQDIMQYGLMNDENVLTDAIPALVQFYETKIVTAKSSKVQSKLDQFLSKSWMKT